MKKLAVFVSGGGSNFQSVLDAIARGEIEGEVSVVISSNNEAYAIKRAQNYGIPAYVFKKSDYGSETERDEDILKTLSGFGVDYILLLGYLGILTPALIAAYRNRIINIHPALLPKFGGPGCYGLNVHKKVLESGEKFSGATVHFVNEGEDTGAIIMQESVPVDKDSTPEELQKYVLENVEHKLIVKAVALLCAGRVHFDGKNVTIIQ